MIRIQPDEGIILKLYCKQPGTTNKIEKVAMNYWQSDVLENIMNTPESYERLIQEARLAEKFIYRVGSN